MMLPQASHKWIVLVALLSISLGALAADPPVDSTSTSGKASIEPSAEALQFFEQKVRPLLISRCYECHASDSEQLGGNLRLDDRDAIVAGGDNGPAAMPGQVTESLLIRAIHYSEVGFEMPPTGKLSSAEIRTMERWVEMGLPMPKTQTTAPTKRVIDIEEGKKHWAFQPLRVGDPPPDPSGWSRNRLDQYVRAAQQLRSYEALPQAEPARLFRRMKLDLIGLPPTPSELAEFAAAPTYPALENWVDRWLNSPAYGERWARFWLELGRYCDVPESWIETQGNAYLYRDWVVQAFNEDMPFDQFAKLQLAADLMPDARSEDVAALGLIGLSPNYWKELQLPVDIIKTIVSDEYEERIHTFSSTFLGLNMACARCHDHKFDPITVRDYYALAGVFANTRVTDRALQPGIDSLAVFEAHKNVEKWQTEQKKVEAELKKLQAEITKLTTGAQALGADQAVRQPDAVTEQASADQLTKLTQQQSEKQSQLTKLAEQIGQAQAIAGYDLPLAPGVIDGTLEVKEAVGTHGSRLVYEATPKDMAIEIRGNPNKTSEVVARRYVSVLSHQASSPWQGSGRLNLAEEMFAQSSALVARVYVNRIWKHHFGSGLVQTPSDFGTQGLPPSHPELLDDLASGFIAHDWSTKWLHRQILGSATYQQQCRTAATQWDSNSAVWYVGMPLQRLDVEQWRDAMLSVTGTLDGHIGGPPSELSQMEHNRRTIYGIVRRRELSDVLRLNDFPDPLTHSASRTATTTPLQQLFMLNSPFMQEQAKRLVHRLDREVSSGVKEKITAAYQWLYGREPTARELAVGQEYLQNESSEIWQEYAQALLASNEFFFVD